MNCTPSYPRYAEELLVRWGIVSAEDLKAGTNAGFSATMLNPSDMPVTLLPLLLSIPI